MQKPAKIGPSTFTYFTNMVASLAYWPLSASLQGQPRSTVLLNDVLGFSVCKWRLSNQTKTNFSYWFSLTGSITIALNEA